MTGGRAEGSAAREGALGDETGYAESEGSVSAGPSHGSSVTWPTWLPFGLILGLAAVLRLFHLGAENLWIDEIFSLQQAAAPWDAVDRYRNIGTRPLSLALLHYVLPFGSSEFLLRLPYAILSILDVGALFLLSRELVERRVALRASLFLAVLPLHVWYAQEVRWYAQWAFLATLVFLALVRLWKTDRARWWVVHALALLAALYTFIVSLHLVIVQAVAAWLLPDRGERRSFRRKVALTTVVVGIVAVPFILIVLGIGPDGSETGPSGGGVGTPRATTLVVLPYLFFTYVAGYTIGPTVAELHDLPDPITLLTTYPEILLYYAFFAPIAALGVWSFRRRRECAAVLGPWVLGLPLLVFTASVMGELAFNVRYAFAAVPGFALLLSLGVESLGRWRLVGTIVAVALFAASLSQFYANPNYDKEHVRDAMQHIRTSPSRDEPVAVVGQGVAAAVYYGEGLEPERLIGCGGVDEEVDRELAPAVHFSELRPEPVFWLLVSRDWQDSAEGCLDALASTHEIRDQARFTGVDLLLLEHR